MENKVFIGLGSNLGDRMGHLSRALATLSDHFELITSSSIYESEAKGFSSSLQFLNQVAQFNVKVRAEEIMKLILEIESSHSRKRMVGGFQNRTLDLDILFYGQEIISGKTLQIPHYQLHLRNFVLVPLMEIAPDFVHPESQKTIIDLYADCDDTNHVFPYLP